MRAFRLLALSTFLLAAGCKNCLFNCNGSDSGGDAGNGPPHASAVNVYNCDPNDEIEVFRRPDNGTWEYIGSMGVGNGPDCPEDAGYVPVQLGGGPYTIRVLYWHVQGECDSSSPEATDAGPICDHKDGYYEGDSTAAVINWEF